MAAPRSARPKPRPRAESPTARATRASGVKDETVLKHAIRRHLGSNPDDQVLWLHVGGSIVLTVQCPNPSCRQRFGVHDHARGARLDAGLGTDTADLVGLVDGGRFFAAEVKTPDGVESKGQAQRRRLINSIGGYAVVVRSPEEAALHAERARAGLPAPSEPGDPAEPTPTPDARMREAFARAAGAIK